MNDAQLKKALQSDPPAKEFTPYVLHSPESDSLTVVLKPDADHSVAVDKNIIVMRSLETHEIVGVRINRMSEVLQ